MKNRLFYPAVFHKAEEGGFWVSFPDFPECMTQGDSMDEAYEMAIDALGLSLSSIEDEGTDIPKASEFETVDPEDGILVIIEFDMAEYRRKHRSKAVKKTLSIPEWLNEAAVRELLSDSSRSSYGEIRGKWKIAVICLKIVPKSSMYHQILGCSIRSNAEL